MEMNDPDRPGAASARAPYSSAGLVTVRPTVAADADACGRVMHDAFRGIADAHGFPPDFASVSDAAGLAAVLIADPAVFGVVAEVGGRVVGSNFLAEGDAVRGVGPITVELSHQGGGIGWRLMAAILERAGPGAPVRLVQDAFNTRSVALYASLGFEVKEPLLLLRGAPRVGPPLGSTVRPLLDRDVAACAELCAAVHGGITRTHELRGARRLFAPVVVERGDRIVGYLTAPGLWLANHGVAETEEDMRALLAGAAAAGGGPVSLLLPTRQAGLFRWCLGAGMRVVKPMTLMAKGGYGEPRGCWFPSVFY
jgi:GNAT superfamily N-acetyltransferase